MPFKKHGRQYDIVVFGATGYSGILTAEHIATHLPADLKWAIAGRSQDKLKQVAAGCKALDADRIQPEIEICNLNDKDVGALARKTFCLITTVGPYARHGEHAFKACAEAGTHYVDCTAEVPWTLEMIKKYEATAKASGACMFPQSAMESATTDMITWAVAAKARTAFGSRVSDVVADFHELQSAPTGGTLSTILNLLDQYPTKTILQSVKPYALSPVPNDHPTPKGTFWSSLTGTRRIPGLGLLGTSPTGKANSAVVWRSWGLLKSVPGLQHEYYGPNFTFREFAHAPGVLRGMLMHYGLLLGVLFLLAPPFRSLLRLFIFKPGEGPDMEEAKKETIEFRAVAKLDLDANNDTAAAASTARGKQIFGKLTFKGSMYYLTAAHIAQAAAVLLEEDDDGDEKNSISSRLKGGIYTTACLGQRYIDRLQEAGFTLQTEVQDV